MRKQILTAVLAAAAAVMMTVPAFAGTWVQTNAGRWRYDTLGRGVEEGFMKSQWAWIDSNYDGISECYYFDADGFMVSNATVDGSTLNESGQWTVDGIVQTKMNGSEIDTAKATDLTATTPEATNFCTVFESAQAATGQTFGNGFMLSGDLSRAPYVTYKLDKKYSVLTFTFAPSAVQTGASQSGKVTVTGLSSSKSLYRSDKVTASSAPVSVTVNVQNEDAVRINLIRGCDVLFTKVMVQ